MRRRIAAIGEAVEIVSRRHHGDAPGRRIAEREARLHVKLACRHIPLPHAGTRADLSDLRQVVDLVPERDARDLDRLDGAPVPDDIEIVETLVVNVVTVGLLRGLVLGDDEIVVVEADVDAEIGLRLQPQFLQQRDSRSEHAQPRASGRMDGGGCGNHFRGMLVHQGFWALRVCATALGCGRVLALPASAKALNDRFNRFTSRPSTIKTRREDRSAEGQPARWTGG